MVTLGQTRVSPGGFIPSLQHRAPPGQGDGGGPTGDPPRALLQPRWPRPLMGWARGSQSGENPEPGGHFHPPQTPRRRWGQERDPRPSWTTRLSGLEGKPCSPSPKGDSHGALVPGSHAAPPQVPSHSSPCARLIKTLPQIPPCVTRTGFKPTVKNKQTQRKYKSLLSPTPPPPGWERAQGHGLLQLSHKSPRSVPASSPAGR